MRTLQEWINPVPKRYKGIWVAGHFWSGREPSKYRYLQGGCRRPHTGLDIAAPAGTPIVAPDDGLVTFSGKSNAAAGFVVSVKHEILYKGVPITVWSRHCHCLSGGLVPNNAFVAQGERIAWVGSTGASAGPHDHTSIFIGVEFSSLQRLMFDPEPVYYQGDYELMQQGHPFPEDVKKLQRRLNAQGYTPKLILDGDYGPKTATAVKWWQKTVGLAQTGEAADITIATLFGGKVSTG